jgi:hypothetical protein
MSLTLAIGNSSRLAPASKATCNDSAKFSTGTCLRPSSCCPGLPSAAGSASRRISTQTAHLPYGVFGGLVKTGISFIPVVGGIISSLTTGPSFHRQHTCRICRLYAKPGEKPSPGATVSLRSDRRLQNKGPQTRTRPVQADRVPLRFSYNSASRSAGIDPPDHLAQEIRKRWTSPCRLAAGSNSR